MYERRMLYYSLSDEKTSIYVLEDQGRIKPTGSRKQVFERSFQHNI